MRPKRASILDNLSPEQQVLWDCFSLESGGAAKLTARRSRRRPGDWIRSPNEPRMGPVPYEILALVERDNGYKWLDTFSIINAYDDIWRSIVEESWTSPTQRGRVKTRQERARRRDRGIDRLVLQGPGGAIEIVASPFVQSGGFVFHSSSDNAVGRLLPREPPDVGGSAGGQIMRHVMDEAAANRNTQQVAVSPRTMAELMREAGQLRTFSTS